MNRHHVRTQILWGLCHFLLFLDAYPGKWRWMRRWIGGKWELWYISITRSACWHDVDDWTPWDGRMPCSEGPLIEKEEYPL